MGNIIIIHQVRPLLHSENNLDFFPEQDDPGDTKVPTIPSGKQLLVLLCEQLQQILNGWPCNRHWRVLVVA